MARHAFTPKIPAVQTCITIPSQCLWESQTVPLASCLMGKKHSGTLYCHTCSHRTWIQKTKKIHLQNMQLPQMFGFIKGNHLLVNSDRWSSMTTPGIGWALRKRWKDEGGRGWRKLGSSTGIADWPAANSKLLSSFFTWNKTLKAVKK